MPQHAETITVAAIGDLHVTENSSAPYREMFAEISRVADVLVLCGDLTNFGKTSEAEILAEDIRTSAIPVIGVLGNHDYECGQPEVVTSILHEAGMTVLDEQAIEIKGVGFAGVKGFMGGYGRGELGAVRRAHRQGVRRRGHERGAQAGEWTALTSHRPKRCGASLFADRRNP